jgi:DNA-binding response OmpR family regulator
MPEYTVLIVEDDERTASLVRMYLEHDGYRVVVARDGPQALTSFRADKPALAILDLTLPTIDGLEICRAFRSASNIPIVILTSRDGESDRVLGFELGADDYVVKPFSPRELAARVRAILRRTYTASDKLPALISRGELVLDAAKRKVTLRGKVVSLTRSEFNILQLLMNSPGRVFTRDDLLESLYPRGAYVVDRVVDVHVGKLRQKIETDVSNPAYILTIRGVGYEFSDRNGHQS